MKETKKKIEGIVLDRWDAGYKSTVLVILTREQGVLHCFVKGAKRMQSAMFSAVQLLSYSQFTLFCGKQYHVDDASLYNTFFSSNRDMKTAALIQYFSELIIKTVPENVPSSEQLDLLLNTLYVLLNKKKDPLLIKTVFEIRLLSASGVRPNLIYCSRCGKYEDKMMYFNYLQNELFCSDCRKAQAAEHHLSGAAEEGYCPLSQGALTAFRYVTLSEPKKIFSFQVTKEVLMQLADCTEKFVVSFCDARLYTLEYYKILCEMEQETDPNGRMTSENG